MVMGGFSAEAMSRGYTVEALEMAGHEREVAKQLFGIEAVNTSFEDYETDQVFEVLLMSQILEHAHDVNAWLEKAHSLVGQNGKLVIALPNFASLFRKVMQEKEPYICPPAHLNFFGADNLARLMNKHGFEVVKTQWVSRMPVTAFTKRLPAIFRPLAPAMHLLANLILKMIDLAKLGMIIRVYAVKKENGIEKSENGK